MEWIRIHILLLAEGYSDDTGLAKFEKDWHGKEYANGKAKLRVREAKLYTLAINEAGREEFLEELKGLTGGFNEYGGNGSEGAFRWDKMIKYVRTMARLFGVKPIDDSKIQTKPVGVAAGKSGWNCHFAVIGEVTDHKNNQGTEQV
jgi:hypothetical protein